MTTRRAVLGLSALVALPAAGWAVWRAGQAEPDAADAAPHAAGGLHLGDDPAAALWRRLMQARRDGGALAAAQFPPAVAALDGRRVTLRGFMIALRDGPAHRRFLFAPNPPGCPGCRPPERFALLDVRGEKPLPAVAEPILLTGVLRLRRHDELVYRLDAAAPVAAG